ncbi:MAG: competence/damage-inducible protein A [bacterium]|nr:competence/damage-inducible protein A [bacterium]
MVAELISVGTELLLGNIVNTNAAFLSREMAALGVLVYYQSTVGDNKDRLKEAVRVALLRSDLVILTGGLGPTRDDLTKEAVAEQLGLPLVEDEETKRAIAAYFKDQKKKSIPENNWKQAMVIQGANVLANHNGTAPGLLIEQEGKKIILLPGPPNEMVPMVKESVLPYLKEQSNEVLYSAMVKIAGMGESAVAMEIEDLIDKQTNPTIAPYAKTGEVHLRITAKADSLQEAKELVKPVVKELRKRFGIKIYTEEESETLEDVVVKLLLKHKLTLITAESCTAGLLTGRIVNVAGVSDVLKEGFITYTNKAKRKLLDVSKSTLKTYTAVSEQTAKEMVKGAAINGDADVAVSITGLAGPGGGTKDIPVGTVYIGCYANEKATVKHYIFSGNREKIRELSVVHALDLMRRCIISNYEK